MLLAAVVIVAYGAKHAKATDYFVSIIYGGQSELVIKPTLVHTNTNPFIASNKSSHAPGSYQELAGWYEQDNMPNYYPGTLNKWADLDDKIYLYNKYASARCGYYVKTRQEMVNMVGGRYGTISIERIPNNDAGALIISANFIPTSSIGHFLGVFYSNDEWLIWNAPNGERAILGRWHCGNNVGDAGLWYQHQAPVIEEAPIIEEQPIIEEAPIIEEQPIVTGGDTYINNYYPTTYVEPAPVMLIDNCCYNDGFFFSFRIGCPLYNYCCNQWGYPPQNYCYGGYVHYPCVPEYSAVIYNYTVINNTTVVNNPPPGGPAPGTTGDGGYVDTGNPAGGTTGGGRLEKSNSLANKNLPVQSSSLLVSSNQQSMSNKVPNSNVALNNNLSTSQKLQQVVAQSNGTAPMQNVSTGMTQMNHTNTQTGKTPVSQNYSNQNNLTAGKTTSNVSVTSSSNQTGSKPLSYQQKLDNANASYIKYKQDHSPTSSSGQSSPQSKPVQTTSQQQSGNSATSYKGNTTSNQTAGSKPVYNQPTVNKSKTPSYSKPSQTQNSYQQPKYQAPVQVTAKQSAPSNGGYHQSSSNYKSSSSANYGSGPGTVKISRK